jgi:hypothetical protein
MGVAKIWTDHLGTDKEKQEFAKLVSTSLVLKRLGDILNGMEKTLDRKDFNELYTSPSWPYEQADRLGHRKGIASVRKLIPDQENK